MDWERLVSLDQLTNRQLLRDWFVARASFVLLTFSCCLEHILLFVDKLLPNCFASPAFRLLYAHCQLNSKSLVQCLEEVWMDFAFVLERLEYDLFDRLHLLSLLKASVLFDFMDDHLHLLSGCHWVLWRIRLI